MVQIVHMEGVTEAEDEFWKAFGRALMSWSYIEHRLFIWFWHLSGMSEPAARGVWFSAKGFNARADMLGAILTCGTYPRKIKSLATFDVALEFGQLLVAKASGYSQNRNTLAHGLGIANATTSGAEILVVQGKTKLSKAINSSTNLEKIKTMNDNFEKLSVLTSRGYQLFLKKDGCLALFPELREQVLLLPNLADCAKPSRKQAGLLRQREAARRKESKILDR